VVIIAASLSLIRDEIGLTELGRVITYLSKYCYWIKILPIKVLRLPNVETIFMLFFVESRERQDLCKGAHYDIGSIGMPCQEQPLLVLVNLF
jgi:hypothetical protein